MDTYTTAMSVYMCHLNSLQSIMWLEALAYMYSTLLHKLLKKYDCYIAYLCPTALLLWYTCRPHITAYIRRKQQTVTFIYHPIATYMPTIIRSLKCHRYAQIIQCTPMGEIYLNIYDNYEFPGINNVTRSCWQMTLDDNDESNAAALLNKLSWPLGQISQNLWSVQSGKDIYTHQHTDDWG